MTHLDDFAQYDFVYGALDDVAWRQAAAHLATCVPCRDAVQALQEEAAHVAASLLAPLPPRAGASARLRETAADPGAHASLVGQLAVLADRTEAQMRTIMNGLDDAALWAAGPAPGIGSFDVEAGPACAGCVVGFVRIAAGTTFPAHTHLGEEISLVLEGTLHDSAGAAAAAGALIVREKGSTHHIRAGDEADLLFFVVIEDGVQVGDEIIGPNDSRL